MRAESERQPLDSFSLRVLFAHVGSDSSVDRTMTRWETHQGGVEKLQIEKPSFHWLRIGRRERIAENDVEALVRRLPSHCQKHNRCRLIAC